MQKEKQTDHGPVLKKICETLQQILQVQVARYNFESGNTITFTKEGKDDDTKTIKKK